MKQSFKAALLAMVLSTNKNTTIVEVEDYKGVSKLDGKINQTSDKRNFYIAEFGDPSNPFLPTVKATIMQPTEGNWRMGDPKLLSGFIGKFIPGVSIDTVDVNAYPVLDADGNQRVNKAGEAIFGNKFTAVVFPTQTIESLAKAAGLTILGEVPAFKTVAENAEVAQTIEV